MKDDFTGNFDFTETKIIKYKFGQYDLKIEVTLENKFIDITEIKLNKDFRSLKQKLAATKVFDVEEYYIEE